jgi:hypothetical protein
MLKIELPWIERFGIELGIELAGIKLTLDRADLGSGQLASRCFIG